MLVEPQEFINESKKIGCTHQEFFICANNLTQKPEVITHVHALGQKLYYKIDYEHNVLTVVTAGDKTVEASDAMYSEVFRTIKHIGH